MNTTTAFALVAALSAAAVIPAGSADLNARTFFDVAAGAEFGQGAGLYDPAGPTFCAALLSFYLGVLPQQFYYTTLVRYEPGLALSHLQAVNAGVPDPTQCGGMIPGDQVYVDLVEVDAGAAVWSFNVLGPTEVANLGATTVEFEYCAAPVAIPGPPVIAFQAAGVSCPAGWLGTYTLYNGAGACNVFTMSTSPGVLDGDQPVFLVDGQSCNTLVNSGSSLTAVSLAALGLTGSDYAAQHCVSTVVTNTMTGVVLPAADSDFFVVGHSGTLAAWASDPGTVLPLALFPNVANLQPDNPAPSC